jgi:hypothetical protein
MVHWQRHYKRLVLSDVRWYRKQTRDIEIGGLVLTWENRVGGGWEVAVAVVLSKLTKQNITRLRNISFNIAEWNFQFYRKFLKFFLFLLS